MEVVSSITNENPNHCFLYQIQHKIKAICDNLNKVSYVFDGKNYTLEVTTINIPHTNGIFLILTRKKIITKEWCRKIKFLDE